MSTPVRVTAFVVALAAVFGAAFGVGRLFEDRSAGPYTLQATLDPDRGGALLLTIADHEGDVTTAYRTRHEKKLHLVAVRSDFGGYRHLHPTYDGSGGWIVENPGLVNGRWRLYADFQPEGGEPSVAVDDVTVTDATEGTAPEPQADVAQVDGFRVDLDGSLVAGREEDLAFRITRDGAWVPTQEYLGAPGHLVAIREKTMDYLHAHPYTGIRRGPEPSITVAVTAPAAGRYHLYLDFKIDGVVRTAAFVVEAGAGSGRADDGAHNMEGMDHGDH